MSEGNKPTTKPSMRGYPALNALVARLDAFFAEKFPEGANQIEKGEAIGIDQSSTGKLMRKLHNPSLEKLQKISEKTGIPAWELIAPIDENIYSSKNTEAWPFELITKSQFDSLTAKQQGAIEMAMLEAFEKITASHRLRSPATFFRKSTGNIVELAPIRIRTATQKQDKSHIAKVLSIIKI